MAKKLQLLSPMSDPEVAGIRTGYDGTVYDTAGDAVREQALAIIKRANNIGHFISFKDVTLAIDTVADTITISDGFIYTRGARWDVKNQTVARNTQSSVSILVYDTSISAVANRTRSVYIEDMTDSQIIIAIISSGKYFTRENPNYIPGKWSVDGVVYPKYDEGTTTVTSTSKTVYVSSDGSDDNAGDIDLPFKTIAKAIDSGATTIYARPGVYKETICVDNNGGEFELLAWIGDYTDSQTDNRVILNFGTELTMVSDASAGLVKASFASTSSDFIYKAFVSKEEDLIYSKDAGNYSFGFTSYACNLWNGTTKLIPVLTLDECKATSGTWYYDGAYVYANGIEGVYTLADGSAEYGIHLVGLNKVAFSGIDVYHARSDCAYLHGCSNVNISRCNFGYSGLYAGLALRNSTGTVRGCEALFNRTDGLNIHGGGTVDFIDCVSHDNGDDGISHHDISGGMVIGGEYYNNGKGGICSPTFGSRNGISNAYTHHNAYGIYALADTGLASDYPEAPVSSCLITNNAVGVRGRRYNITCWNCTLSNNVTDTRGDDGGVVTIMGDDSETVDFIPAPTTAEVGQTIVVKEIDENGKPISWECADVSGEEAWELIAEITTTEDVTSVEITTDADGNVFELGDINIIVVAPSSINKLFFNAVYVGSTTWGRLAYLPNGNRRNQYLRKTTYGYGISMFGGAADAVSEASWLGFIGVTTKGVTAIQITRNEGNIPANTVIYIKGVRR